MSEQTDNFSHDTENEDMELFIDLDEGSKGGEEDTEGIWLLSYADLMTLLMGFFALMTSMGNFDEETFNSVSEGAAKYFKGEIAKPFGGVGQMVTSLIEQRGLSDQVKTTVSRSGLTIQFEGTLLFGSGDFKLKETSNEIMKELIQILSEETGDKKVLIEGHTDDNPIKTGIIASNWELSSLRANSVARLFENYNFKKEQILTLGFAETRPLVPNRNELGEPIKTNQDKNRRVVIKVSNKHPL